MIRVILVDEHALACDGVRRLLEDAADVRVAGTFADATGAVRFLARQALDVALLAIRDDGGIDLARRMRAVSPKTAILILCQDARAEAVRQALWAGASGYLLLESASDEVMAAVRAVHAGCRYLSSRIAARGTFAPDPLERLSAREMEVLKLVVEGNTSAEVAARLGLSPKSIDTYRSRLMTKLEVHHLAGLVKFAIRRGLTSP
jgi:DNA-binding NarL/FixJ family response regulator